VCTVWKRELAESEENVYGVCHETHETNGAGVMTELHHLTNTVAGQRYGQQSGHDGGHWQHPADLTRSVWCGPYLLQIVL
ncbi:hypothetical protein IRJ41_003015, partial [Triplophysa rosa]